MAEMDDIWSRKTKKLKQDPKMIQLVEFTNDLREDSGERVPDFDPDDGGIEAEVLFVFQDPGPTVGDTGFISRDNYLFDPKDHSAMRVIEASDEAGLDRTRTVSWNAIPWHVSDATRKAEFNRAKDDRCLTKLLRTFENQQNHRLKAVALFGKGYACKLAGEVRDAWPDLRIFEEYHPSDRGVPSKQKREHLKETFRQIKEYLG